MPAFVKRLLIYVLPTFSPIKISDPNILSTGYFGHSRIDGDLISTIFSFRRVVSGGAAIVARVECKFLLSPGICYPLGLIKGQLDILGRIIGPECANSVANRAITTGQ